MEFFDIVHIIIALTMGVLAIMTWFAAKKAMASGLTYGTFSRTMTAIFLLGVFVFYHIIEDAFHLERVFKNLLGASLGELTSELPMYLILLAIFLNFLKGAYHATKLRKPETEQM